MPKINREEYEVLKELDDKWKWIARDKDRDLYAFTEKPVRKYDVSPNWDTETEVPYSALELIDEIHLFQFIQWEDEEPHNIAELIEEYEDSKEYKDSLVIEYFLDKAKESEEAEVRKEKIINGLRTLRGELANNYKDNQRIGFIAGVNRAIEFIHSTDEPEVLTQEWIGEHTWNNHYIGRPFVYVDDLQNLIVPKQELPVIPNYVAKWISVHHEQFDLYPALKRLESNALSWEDVYEWYRKNTRKFVNAYLTGKYEVEEEQKYLVNILDEGIGAYLIYYPKSGNYGVTGILDDSKGITRFTEQEIKDYDIRYWPFRVKVEELEE